VALIAGTLLVGGLTTYAAATASANSQPVSLGGSSTFAASTDPAPATTTTTSPAPRTSTSLGSVVTQSIGESVLPGHPTVSPGGESGGPGNPITQTIGIAVLPGVMTVAPTSESTPLTQIQAFGHSVPDYQGALSPITVNDARGSLVGWRATVSLQAVSGLDAAQLASTRLCVTPHPTTLVAGNPADFVRSSPRVCAGPGDLISVFSAAPGGGGGAYSDTADIVLLVPHGTVAAAPTASLAVSVS
jgi:hypothetical protein